jgi:hypothetical protein
MPLGRNRQKGSNPLRSGNDIAYIVTTQVQSAGIFLNWLRNKVGFRISFQRAA